MRLPVSFKTLLLTASVVATSLEPALLAAGPKLDTVRAWREYVASTEARIERELASPAGFLVTDFSSDRIGTRDTILRGAIPVGKLTTSNRSDAVLTVPSGTIAHWRGAVLVPDILLDELLVRLQHPNERGPFQQDVVAIRVRERTPDMLKLSIRMTRKAIVTVTYDTDHVVTYRRLGAHRAASKSVSTRIVEVADAGTASERVGSEEDDRGFLWKMNAYWRFEQVSGGVIVELESVTLSRSVPMGLGMVVEPLIDRVARESITRTLVSIRELYGKARPGRHD